MFNRTSCVEDHQEITVSRTAGEIGIALAEPENRPRSRRPQDLTPRELEILQLVWEGLTNRLIGERLKISIKTAEAHRANMMKKLRVSNTAQLVKVAIEGGLLQPSYVSRREAC